EAGAVVEAGRRHRRPVRGRGGPGRPRVLARGRAGVPQAQPEPRFLPHRSHPDAAGGARGAGQVRRRGEDRGWQVSARGRARSAAGARCSRATWRAETARANASTPGRRVWVLAALGLFGCQAVKNVAAGKGTSEDLQQIGDVAQKGAKIAKAVTNLGESLTAEQEYWVGRSIATNLLAKSDYKYENKADIAAGKLVGITAYANNVGALIAFAATETHRDGDRPAPILCWHFVVVDSDTVNGFAAPGGFVFVTTAALKLAKNEDELAGILAHEVAHVVRGHALGNIQKSRYAGLTQDVLEAAGSATL